ncbi:mechanosensitive ion channel family protein [Nocardioides sp.]|uniref:mechanosensitive ion channel family protein n=1 Tax=Nocardioides sp. TaxID=35761 RepID=UPI0039E64CA1
MAHDALDWMIGRPLAIVGVIVLGLLVRWICFKVVDRIVARAEAGMLPDAISGRLPGDSARRVQRARTVADLIKSIITGVLVAIVGTMVLDQLGVNIAPIIASAGIVGLALGFGAQSLVKDFLSGVFMIFEDQYGVGDLVDLGAMTGTASVGRVESVSLRITRLRDEDGTVWFVRNGEVLRVGNFSRPPAQPSPAQPNDPATDPPLS